MNTSKIKTMKKEDAIKYLQQLYPNGGHCWLDEQRIEAIGMAINALQEEPVSEKKCMFTKDSYTDEDRKVLCKNCDEKCEYSKKEEPASEGLEEAAKEHAVERFRTTRDEFLAEKCKWSFKAGAKWQKEKFIDKAVQWIKERKEAVETEDNGIAGWIPDYFIEDFKKEMEDII